MLTCKDASHLVSHSQDRPLSFRERLELRIHLWVCANCRQFERQMGLMRRLLRQPTRQAEAEAEAETADTPLSAEARERISQTLAEQHERAP